MKASTAVFTLFGVFALAAWVLGFFAPGPFAVDPWDCLTVSFVAFVLLMAHQNRPVQMFLLMAAAISVVMTRWNYTDWHFGPWFPVLFISLLVVAMLAFFVLVFLELMIAKGRDREEWSMPPIGFGH